MARIAHALRARGQYSVRQTVLYRSLFLFIDPTHVAGVDMHEIAVCSGLAAAYQLGAEYVTKSIRIKGILANTSLQLSFQR